MGSMPSTDSSLENNSVYSSFNSASSVFKEIHDAGKQLGRDPRDEGHMLALLVLVIALE